MTWCKEQAIVLKEEYKSKDIIIAKISRTLENLMSKKTQKISWYDQTNSNPPENYPSLWDLMSELSPNSNEIQEEVAKSPSTKQPKSNVE